MSAARQPNPAASVGVTTPKYMPPMIAKISSVTGTHCQSATSHLAASCAAAPAAAPGSDRESRARRHRP